MKKLILSLLMIAMLTGCVSESVKQEEVTTTVGTEYSSITEVNTSVSDKYYVAIKFEDNPYFANDLIYSCYPDGMPRKYTEKHSDGSDFSSFSDGYDFYVELTEEGIKAFTDEDEIQYLIDLLEIKYVEVE